MNTNKHQELKLMHMNIQSLKNKVLQLNVFLSEVNPEIICITEHWAHDEELEQINLFNYKLSKYSCRSQHRGGGTAIYARSGIELESLDVNIPSIERHFEFSCTHYKIKGKHFTLLCIYRSPSGDMKIALNKLAEVIDILYSPLKYLIVVGDFNINFAIITENSKNIIELLSSYGLVSHISGITRPTAASGSQIDNIFSNIPDNNLIKGYNIESTISDHYCQILDINYNIATIQKYMARRFFTPSNIINFRNYL